MPMIELHEGFYVRIGSDIAFAVVKASSDGESCSAFTDGQSAVDGGFLIPYKASEVCEQLDDAEEKLYSEEPDEEEED
jgi:hypothetical protein